jgi:hypothetical protein
MPLPVSVIVIFPRFGPNRYRNYTTVFYGNLPAQTQGHISVLGQVIQVSILSPVEGCGFSGESVQTRILRRAQGAGAPKNERTLLNLH